MSKQIQFTKTGSPDVLQIVDVEIPAPKADEVQIQIHAIGLSSRIYGKQSADWQDCG